MAAGGRLRQLGWRGFVRLGCFVAFLIAAHYLVTLILELIDFEIRPSNEDMVHRTIMVSAVAYSLLLAVPFVPGAEIGLALIAMFGPPIVLLVYVSTLTGLALSFAVGRLIAPQRLIKVADALDFTRLGNLLREIEPLNSQQRLELLTQRAPHGLLPWMLRYRYVALGVAINVPGNVIIGGGGGIALMAGLSRLYTVPGFLITIALATAPVPLAVIIFGKQVLQ